MREQIVGTATGLVGRVREEADARRTKRRRSHLMCELGEMCFRSHTGQEVSDKDVQDLVGRISELRTTATDETGRTDSVAATANGDRVAETAEPPPQPVSENAPANAGDDS